jgi:Transposase IS66 family
MQIPDINLDAITDPAARQMISQLLNLLETLSADNQALRVENQHLRDELARLNGGSGKPEVKPATPPARPPDHSSERERRTPKPRHKARKIGVLVPTRTEPCRLDPATLPPDAIRHGTTELLVQDLLLQPEIIRFVREVWYVPSTGATITAPLPQGYQGEFGPHIQALTLTLGHGANVSQPALLTFYHDAGIVIGKGTIARWLRDHRGAWRADAQAIHQAGLAGSAWQATDQTATRVDGQNETCHVLGNPFFTVYQTRPGGTRQDVLAVLWGQEPRFRLNADALAWLDACRISRAVITKLCASLPWDRELTATALTHQLAAADIILGAQQRQQVWDALAVAAYHAQTTVPIVRRLLSDDAAVYHLLTDEHALCWIHDARQYTKLMPVVPLHHQLLASFRTAYWDYYRALVAYRAAPSAAEQACLRARFDELFSQRTGYLALDERIAKTWANQELLLLVLDHPDLPLHNNDMELAARRRVRKRDVSFGPQSRAGAHAWDTFQTIIATATKLGVRVYAYFLERLLAPATTPTLADHIRERTGAAACPNRT